RISRGTLELDSHPQDLKPLIQEAVNLLRPEIDAHRHHLDLELPESPLWAQVDGVRLVQAVSNVLGNGVRFTPDGGRLGLTLARDGEQAIIRVTDNGVGIDPEQLPKLFTPFTRLDNPSSHRPGGLGLGLALAHDLVELHGGRLEAFSEGHDRGSTFVIHLPALPEHWQPDEAHTPAAASADEPPSAWRVLVVDDDQQVAKALALLLRALGHEVQTLHQGREAVARVRDWQPQVVLIDLGMPDISGYEVARQLRREVDGDIILVAVTGYGLEEDIRKTREAGFDHHLLKPAQVEEIQAILGRQPRQASS
ncbi:MAG: ATP-binding protein, partial [Candidatus Competibacteraceae bacterium]|nr:ATP-binding protein [Candidatus Competibacteraceae bacterium]